MPFWGCNKVSPLGKLRIEGRANQFNSGGGIFHVTHRLWRCLCYVELNMVRCGVVSHPREWEWVGYHEIMGRRRRCRLLDLDRLHWRLATDDAEEVRRHLEAALTDAIARGELKREPLWTESLAVGSAGFVEKIKPMVLPRRDTEVTDAGDGVNVLQESAIP